MATLPGEVMGNERSEPGRRKRAPRHVVRWLVLSVGLALTVTMALVFGSRLGGNATLVRSPLVGKAAPAFELAALGGGTVRSSELAGRPYVVNFWAYWCVPCRKEAPALESFWRASRERGVAVVGVVYNDEERAAEDFRREFGLTYPQAMDPDGRAAIDFGVFGVPETFVVDQRGVVMAKLMGAVGPGTLESVMETVLAGETFSARNDDYRTAP